MSDAVWPIRVCGEYRGCEGYEDLVRKVLTVDGPEVSYRLVDDDGAEFGSVKHIRAADFRAMVVNPDTPTPTWITLARDLMQEGGDWAAKCDAMNAAIKEAGY